jgi:hypothetical protein
MPLNMLQHQFNLHSNVILTSELHYVVLLSHLTEVITPLICVSKVPNSSFGWDRVHGGKMCVCGNPQ